MTGTFLAIAYALFLAWLLRQMNLAREDDRKALELLRGLHARLDVKAEEIVDAVALELQSLPTPSVYIPDRRTVYAAREMEVPDQGPAVKKPELQRNNRGHFVSTKAKR